MFCCTDIFTVSIAFKIWDLLNLNKLEHVLEHDLRKLDVCIYIVRSEFDALPTPPAPSLYRVSIGESVDLPEKELGCLTFHERPTALGIACLKLPTEAGNGKIQPPKNGQTLQHPMIRS